MLRKGVGGLQKCEAKWAVGGDWADIEAWPLLDREDN